MNFGNYFEQREREILKDDYTKMFCSGKDTPFRGITVNTRLVSVNDFIKIAPFNVKKSGFADQSLYIADKDIKPGLHPFYHAGVYYVQEPSASSAAAALQPKPNDKVLDLCAAPGGKSAQLSAMLNSQGLLFSNEYVASRSRILLSNTERMGSDNTIVLNEEPVRLEKCFEAYFDKILVDAPCSGEGMFRKEPQALAQHSEALVLQCAYLQAQILDSAAKMLKNGGEMVYSTCTFSPQENEGNIGAFLKRHPDFCLIDCNLSCGVQGRTNCCVNGEIDVKKVRRIYPCHGGEGHFVAKMQKIGPVEKTQKYIAPKSDKKPKEYEEFIQKYFPLLYDRAIKVNDDEIYVLPNTPLPKMSGIHVLRAGILAGKIEKNRFIPHHSLFKAFGDQCTNKIDINSNDIRLAQFLRGEEIEDDFAANGYVAITVNGFSLGFGKKSDQKVKNHYPKGLRNLK